MLSPTALRASLLVPSLSSHNEIQAPIPAPSGLGVPIQLQIYIIRNTAASHSTLQFG